jgi:hypothetical protein
MGFPEWFAPQRCGSQCVVRRVPKPMAEASSKRGEKRRELEEVVSSG